MLTERKKPAREKVLKKLKELKPLLEKRYGVKRLGLFGSTVRGENGPESDVDILVKVENPEFTLLKFVNLKLFLEEELDCKVDLVMEEALKEELKEAILREVVYVQ